MRGSWLTLACLVLCAAACDDTIFQGGGEEVSGVDGYEGVQEIVAVHCDGCHSPAGGTDPDLSDDLHGATVDVVGIYGVPIVEPGNLENSMLYLKTTNQQGSGEGGEMPVGSGGLSAPENEIIANWILDGAPSE